MDFKVGDKVEVNRRIDIKNTNHDSPREWKTATVLRGDYVIFWVRFDDNYGNSIIPYGIRDVRPLAHLGDRLKMLVDALNNVATPKKVLHDSCPTCSDRGEWRMMALVCRNGHGKFAG